MTDLSIWDLVLGVLIGNALWRLLSLAARHLLKRGKK